MLSQERIMFHYSLLGDSNVEGSFYFFWGGGDWGLKYLCCYQNKRGKWIFLPIFNTLGLDCSKLGEDNPG